MTLPDPRTLRAALFMLLAVYFMCACANIAATPDWPEIDSARVLEPNRLILGQPSPAELVALERAGARHVVNVRGIGELDAWDEGELVAGLGMVYHHLPIGGADDLDFEAVVEFDRLLGEIGDQPAVLHCASGNRIGALYALRAAWLQGKDPEAAIAIGRVHGLTSLEPAVRDRL